MNLIQLIQKPESKTLEFKRDLSSPEKIICTLIAFANTSGGILLIGVDDKTRAIVKLDNLLKKEEQLASIIADNIFPKVIPSIEILSWKEMQVIAVKMHPSSSKPHYYKKKGLENGTFVRIGSANRKADFPLIEELKRSTRNEPFDGKPLPQLNADSLDRQAIIDLFTPVRKIRTRDLETLQLITEYQGQKVPTVAGLLLFGREEFRRKWFPDAWIACARFVGSDKNKFMDTADYYDLPILALEKAFEFVKKHSFHQLTIEGLNHKKERSIPMEAVRELLINAIVHADYSQIGSPIRVAIFDDRIEIDNPGILAFGLTSFEIQQGVSRLRNRVFGRVFKELGKIEQWGSGIPRVLSICKENHLPKPSFEEIGYHFRVTLFLKAETQTAINEREQLILKAVKGSEEGLSTNELAATLHITPRMVRIHLKNLINKGQLFVVGKSSKDPKRRYFYREATSDFELFEYGE